MEIYYFESPHKQITEDFEAKVIKVTDGDTIRVEWEDRDFDFPIRFLNINTPEKNEESGIDTKEYLKSKIEGEMITVKMNLKNRVDKYGRLLGEIIYNGISMNEDLIRMGKATSFEDRNLGKIPQETIIWP